MFWINPEYLSVCYRHFLRKDGKSSVSAVKNTVWMPAEDFRSSLQLNVVLQVIFIQNASFKAGILKWLCYSNVKYQVQFNKFNNKAWNYNKNWVLQGNLEKQEKMGYYILYRWYEKRKITWLIITNCGNWWLIKDIIKLNFVSKEN